MGIRGLTTYINNRSNLYLEDYKLHDCNIVIDGNSIACQLYTWHCKSHDCFGGDYDKYARIVRNFFKLLSDCNIQPYVIFDGGYEKRKIRTVIDRMKNKIRTAEALCPVTEGSHTVFPLFLRETFIDILYSLKVKVARCTYEGDMEISNIGKLLNCPVLSYDSDFYIFGCLYIPFSTVELNLKKSKFNYISCKIYKVEMFLNSFGGLNPDNLPVLAVLLGNDYVKASLFAPFFKNLKMQKCHGVQSEQQKRIKSVIVWLQNETPESAIKNILGRFKKPRRKVTLYKIKRAMSGYSKISTELLQHLGLTLYNTDLSKSIDFKEIESRLEEMDSIGSNSDCEEQSEESEESEEEIMPFDKFLDNFRKCIYPSCFMDILVCNKYYCVPQVEDGSEPHSHNISLDLLSIIHKILTNDNKKNLTIIARSGQYGIKHYSLPKCILNVPVFEQLSITDQATRQEFLLTTLNISEDFQHVINQLPSEHHLFLFALKYCTSKDLFELPLITAILLCFYVLSHIDVKIGYCRSLKALQKKMINIGDSTLKDCVKCLETLMPYFHMDMKLRSNYKLYDKAIVHSMSKVQSCFLHIKYLNCLLNFPFPNLIMHTIFDGTFIYNMTVNFRKRSNVTNYLEILLKESTYVLENFKHIIQSISPHFTQVSLNLRVKRAKRKKRKEAAKEEVNIENEETSEQCENVIDPNNFYSILYIS